MGFIKFSGWDILERIRSIFDLAWLREVLSLFRNVIRLGDGLGLGLGLD